ncbi:MAG: hypothetical protein LBN23_02845, partial [Paludibacter sp.]|nr:hypothetical protein [Paludibacter sp.]
MKKIFSIILLTAAIFTAVYSQDKTRQVNGKEYRVYIVESGEGRFAISKKFNITQDELVNIN